MATLIGDGGHARDIAEWLPLREGWDRVKHHTEFDGVDPYIIGVNNPHLRFEIRQQFEKPDLYWRHPLAYVSASCDLNWGVHVNYGVTMTRARIGHHCTISPGVTICGDVTIGYCTLIGAGAVICDRTSIGSDVTIGAGTIILPESVIPDGTTWVGNPARKIR